MLIYFTYNCEWIFGFSYHEFPINIFILQGSRRRRVTILYSSLSLRPLPVSNIKRLARSLLQRVHYFIRCIRETRIAYHWGVRPCMFLFSLNNQNSQGKFIHSHNINIFLWKQKILAKRYSLFQNNDWLSGVRYWNLIGRILLQTPRTTRQA